MAMENKQFISLNKKFIKFNGMYGFGKNFQNKLLYFIWRLINVVTLIVVFVQLIIAIFIKQEKTLLNTAGNVVNSGIYLASALRVIYYYIYSEEVTNIFHKLNNFFKHNSIDGETTENMNGVNKVTRKFCLLWYTNCLFMTQAIVWWPLIKTHDERVLALEAWYPWDWKITPLYVLVYALQSFAQFLMTLGYNNADLFFTCAMILTGKQFDVLGYNFKNLMFYQLLQEKFQRDDVLYFFRNVYHPGVIKIKKDIVIENILNTIQTKEFNDKLENKLKNSIRFHQELLKFCDQLQNFFSPILLLSLAYGTFYIIFLGFCIIITKQTAFMQYFITAVVQIFILSYSGQYLSVKSEEFRVIIHDMPWYFCTEKFKSTYKIIQIRTTRGVQITAGKIINVSIQTFLGICRMSMSYFTVLQQLAMDK